MREIKKMKPVIIITLAFVLFIPLSVFAEENSVNINSEIPPKKSAEFDLGNLETMVIELIIGGIIAFAFFYRQQKVINEQRKITRNIISNELFLTYAGINSEKKRYQFVFEKFEYIKSWMNIFKNSGAGTLMDILVRDSFENRWNLLVRSDSITLISQNEYDKILEINPKIKQIFQRIEAIKIMGLREMGNAKTDALKFANLKFLLKELIKEYDKMLRLFIPLKEIDWTKIPTEDELDTSFRVEYLKNKIT